MHLFGGEGKEVSFRDIINCTNKWSEPHQLKYNVQSVWSTAPSSQSATDHDSDQFAGLFLAAFLLLTAANGKHTNIYLDLHHFVRPDVSEEQHPFDSWKKPQTHKPHLFCKHLFFWWLLSGLTAGKWSIPSRRALICRPTCCRWTHALRCSLNSASFLDESAQPGDHPLWDQSAARKRIWGARLSALWSVIPQINMKIMCKACTPVMLPHFFRKVFWNLELMHEMYWKWLDEDVQYKMNPIRRTQPG